MEGDKWRETNGGRQMEGDKWRETSEDRHPKSLTAPARLGDT